MSASAVAHAFTVAREPSVAFLPRLFVHGRALPDHALATGSRKPTLSGRVFGQADGQVGGQGRRQAGRLAGGKSR
eukprot:15417013-Alexandrium_andersonii.AAC.1